MRPSFALTSHPRVAVPAAVQPSWIKGFHGAVSVPGATAGATDSDTLPEYGAISVRDLALSRRSMGVQKMAVLTTLPVLAAAAAAPSSLTQAHHVGLNTAPRQGEDCAADAGQVPDEPSAAASRRVPLDPWDHIEPLSAYIDRRLSVARILLLPNRSRAYAFFKRMIDILGSLVLIVVTLPVMALLAVLIKIDSPGPAIFRQVRVTRGGATFRFYKFRTMWTDAKERFPDLYAYQFADTEFDAAYYKLTDDPRNTRVGRWLRRTTLDELPNLFNVLKGDISLVGPRPELPELVQFYRPEELACFFTKAGLTGLAQVAGRSLLTVRQRLTLDVRYVSQQNLLLDQRILWRTVKVVLLGRGAF